MNLRRLALAAGVAGIVVAAALTLGRSPERPAPVQPERQAVHSDDLAAALRRCAGLDATRIEAAGCMAVWDENRRHFLGQPARLLAPTPAIVIPPVLSAPSNETDRAGTTNDAPASPIVLSQGAAR